MRFTIWPPQFKDLPKVEFTLPSALSKKGVEILYGFTQPSRPYDKTLFVHLVLPVRTTKTELKKLSTQLKNLVKKAWDDSQYEIAKIDQDIKAYQSFTYFHLKHTQKAVMSPGKFNTPLKVERPKPAKKTRERSGKKTTRKKATVKKTAKKRSRARKSPTQQRSSSKRSKHSAKKTRKKTSRRSTTKRKTSKRRARR